MMLMSLFSLPGLRKAQLKAGLCSAFVSYLFQKIFLTTLSDQLSHLTICQTDPHQICRISRLTAADECAEVSFSIPQGTWSKQPILCGQIRAESIELGSLAIRQMAVYDKKCKCCAGRI